MACKVTEISRGVNLGTEPPLWINVWEPLPTSARKEISEEKVFSLLHLECVLDL